MKGKAIMTIYDKNFKRSQDSGGWAICTLCSKRNRVVLSIIKIPAR
jgi:hypothetical protein